MTTELQDAAIATIDDEYLKECVRINPEDIQSEYLRIPADLAYWNAQYATALRAHLMAEVDLKIMKGRLIPMIREQIVIKGGKPTVDQVDALVESNEDYIAQRYELVGTEVAKNEAYGKLDAIRSKKEMLISLGAHIRAEMEGDPSLRETVGARRRMA